MITPRKMAARLLAPFTRRRFDREMIEEMQTHLEMQIAANRACGMSPEEARCMALRQFGGVAQLQERCREQHGWGWLDDFLNDLKYAARSLSRTPGFTLIVLATLACGIGATTAVFSGVNALLLRPLPVSQPGQLVVLAASGPGVGTRDFPYPLYEPAADNLAFPYPFYTWFSEHSQTLSDVVTVTGWATQRPLLASGFGATEPETAVVEEVSGNYFTALGVPMAAGRPLMTGDDAPDAPEPAIVVSYDFWQRRLGADPAAVGRTVHLDGVPATIVGVAGRGFTGLQVGSQCDLWAPIQKSPVLDVNMPWGNQAVRDERLAWVHVLGRLRHGVSREQAAAELDGLFQNKLAELDPRRHAPAGSADWAGLLEQHLRATPAGTGYGGIRAAFTTPITVLMTLVGVLQLAACANVAGLLLARATAREHEFAVRAALGASRSRVTRQLLTESLVLAVFATLLGVGLASAGTQFLQQMAAGLALSIDSRVLLFAGGLTLLTALIAGLAPAWRLSRQELHGSLKSIRAPRSRLNSTLVAAQLGLAFVLLTIAGLLVRTLYNVSTTDTGFARRDRLLFELGVAPEIPPVERAPIYQRIATSLAERASVEKVSYYQGINLLGDTALMLEFNVPGRESPAGPPPRASLVNVGPRFFETMGIPLLRGRDLNAHDEVSSAQAMPALVIGEWAANQLFRDVDPLGRGIQLGGRDFEVVGVVKDVKYGGLRDAPQFIFYMPAGVMPNAMRMTYVLQTSGNPAAMAQPLRTVVQQLDSRSQMSGFRTIARQLDTAAETERFTARLAGFFGMFALTLSGLGLFGLLSYTVSRRTREIGIRLALGSPTSGILRGVVQEGARLWLVGCGLGAAVTLFFARSVGGLLYQVQPGDPLTYLIAGGTLLAVAIAACLWPALRATKVDPIIALRTE